MEGQNTRTNPIYHIVESVDMEKMAEETPTDFYYDALRKDMGQRYPRADPHLLDHLVSLEGFLASRSFLVFRSAFLKQRFV